LFEPYRGGAQPRLSSRSNSRRRRCAPRDRAACRRPGSSEPGGAGRRASARHVLDAPVTRAIRSELRIAHTPMIAMAQGVSRRRRRCRSWTASAATCSSALSTV